MTNDDDGLVIALLLAAAATFVLPAVLLRRAHALTDWLLSHHVLVVADHALVTIPGVAAGLDGRRLVVALLLAPAAGWFLGRAVRLVKVFLRPRRGTGGAASARGGGR